MHQIINIFSGTLRLIACFSLSLCIVACGNSSNSTNNSKVITEPEKPQSLSEQLDQYLMTNFSESDSGIAVLVAEGENKVYQGNIGLADKTNHLPIDQDTAFRLASVSKPFTAVAIFILIEQGQLNLDDSILSYLPELDESWRDITVASLLSHQSGITNFFSDDFISALGWDWLNELDNQRVLEYFINNAALDFPANSQAVYSNSNYLLLAMIIERVSGEQFSSFMMEQLFTPLALANTYIIDNKSEPLVNEALNYGETHLMYNTELYINGSGGQVSSVNDLWRLLNALLAQEIISEQSLNQILTTQATFSDGSHYGFGWAIDELSQGNGLYFYHTGSNDSFKSRIAVVKESGLMVIILSNAGDNVEGKIQDVLQLVIDYYNLS